MPKTFVTGGSGHVGANLVRALLARGEAVKALVRPQSNNRALDGLDVERVQGDLRDAASIDRAVDGLRPRLPRGRVRVAAARRAAGGLRRQRDRHAPRAGRRRSRRRHQDRLLQLVRRRRPQPDGRPQRRDLHGQPVRDPPRLRAVQGHGRARGASRGASRPGRHHRQPLRHRRAARLQAVVGGADDPRLRQPAHAGLRARAVRVRGRARRRRRPPFGDGARQGRAALHLVGRAVHARPAARSPVVAVRREEAAAAHPRRRHAAAGARLGRRSCARSRPTSRRALRRARSRS